MNKSIFFLLFSGLGVIYTLIGYKASQSIKTLDDYFLAGRKLGVFSLAIALIATQLGGGAILGTSKESYHVGLYGVLYVVSICLGFIILSCGVARRLRTCNVNTTAELFETKYNSTPLKKIASIVSIISLTGILMAQIVASRNLLVSLDVYHELLFILFWLLIIAYTMLGGLSAIVMNDIFQLSFIIAVFVGIFLYEIFTNGGQVWQVLTQSSALFPSPEPFTLGRLFGIILIPACYSLIEQDIAQHIFAARSPRIAVIGSLVAGIVMLLFVAIPVYFGMKAFVLNVPVPEMANPLMYLFDQHYSPLIVALVAYGILAAIISTADALLCAISSHIIQDFNLVSHTKQGLLASKVVMLIVGLIALVVSHSFNNIIDIIVGSYDIPVMTIFVSLFIAYFTDKVTKTGAYLSFIIGFTAFIIFKVLKLYPVFSAEGVALLLSLGAYLFGYLIDYVKKQRIS